MHPTHLVVLLAAAAALPAQRTLIVDSVNGPYKTIQAAVNKAAANDVVLVRGKGPYAGAKITRGIRLLGANRPLINSTLIVTSIATGQHMTMSDLTMGAKIDLGASSGSIHLEAIWMTTPNAADLSIQACDHVSMTACATKGQVRANRSAVTMTQCSVSPSAGDAVLANNTRLVVTQSTLVGGAGGCRTGPYPRTCYPGPAAGVAIRAQNQSTVVVTGSTLRYGTESGSCPFRCVRWDLEFDSTSRVTLDSRQLAKNWGTIRRRAIHYLEATGDRPGGVVPVSLHSSATAQFAVFVGMGGKPFGAEVGPWLQPASATLLYADVVRNGTSSRRLRVPGSAPHGLAIVFQALVLTQSKLELSTAAAVVLH